MQQFAHAWLSLIVDISIKSLLLAGAAGLALFLLRLRDTNLRHRVWTAVLLGMLAMPALVYVTPAVPLPQWLTLAIRAVATEPNSISEKSDDNVPANSLNSAGEGSRSADSNFDAVAKSAENELRSQPLGVMRPRDKRNPQPADSTTEKFKALQPPTIGGQIASRLPQVLAGLYISVAFVFVARLLVGLALTQRLISRAGEIPILAQLPSPRPRSLRMLESNLVHVPVTVGFVRPVVLLPARWKEWSESKLQAVLAHEMAHVRRADWLVMTLAELNRALYWFHPVAWMLRRRLSELAEQNCDDAVLEADGNRTQYAKYLLEVASSLAGAGARYRPPVHSVAMARRPNVETRIDAILDAGRPLARRLGALGITGLLVIGIPLILLAAALRTAAEDPQQMPAAGSNSKPGVIVEFQTTTTSSPAGQQPTAVQDAPLINVHGHVLNDTGAPVAKARVVATQARFIDWQYLRTEHRQIAETKSGADGSFTIAVPRVERIDFRKNRLMSFDWRPPTIVATAANHLSSWVGGGEMLQEGEEPFQGDVVLRVQQASHKIRGHLVSLEGQPLAGLTAAVKMLVIAEPEKVSPWLKTVERLRKRGKLPQPGAATGATFVSAMVWDASASNGSNDPQNNSPYFPMKSRMLPEHPLFPPSVRSDIDGHFEFDGFPPDSLAVLEISGPGIATHTISVLNRDIERIDVAQTGFPGADCNGYYGAKFDHPVAPGTAIVGTVADNTSGRPLPGVRISAYVVVNRMQLTQAKWTSETGAKGEFRIDGLPQSGKKYADILPGVEQPYLLSKAVEVPNSSGAIPAEMEIKLRRGVLVRGKVTDEQTGAPVDATVLFHPLLSNENAKDFGYDPQVIQFDPGEDRQRTDEKGEFRAVAIPGQGILGVQSVQWGDYCDGLGSDNIKLTADGRFLTYNYASPKLYNRVAEIDVPANAEFVDQNLTVSHGVNITLNVQDPQGQPLLGVRSSGQTPISGPGDEEAGRSSLEFKALRPGETRRVVLLHQKRRLGRIVDVVAPDKGSEATPRTVTLEACGVVIGRIVDGEGKPIGDLQFAASAKPMRDFDVAVPQQVATDADGKFRFEYLPSGAIYQIGGFNQPLGYVELLKEIELKPGETIDLGTIDVTSKNRPEPIRTPAASIATKSTLIARTNDAENALMPAKPAAKRSTVHGRIVGVDGKPTAGVDVAIVGMRATSTRGGDLEPQGAVLAETKTDANGQYHLELTGVTSKTHRLANVIARGSKTALAWSRLNLDADNVNLPFELHPEQTISGRLVDIEGQPAVAVDLRISSMAPRVSGDQPPSEGVGFIDCPKPPAAWPQPTVTDGDGRFAVRGIPKDNGVFLEVKGNDRFAPQSLALNTGMPEQRGERDGTYRPQVIKDVKPGEEAVLPLAPAQIFTGTVRFEDTGEPAANARLTVWASQQKNGSMLSFAGKADEKGRFKINPNPGIRFGITAYPPDGAAYLVRELKPIDWKSGDRSMEVEAKLPRGVLVHGQVLEQGSDAPIAGASIQYVPETATNPNKPEGIRTGWQDIHLSDEKGRFQIVVLSGRGRILIHGPQNDFVFRETSQLELYSGRPGGQRNYAHAIERLDPAQSAEPPTVTVHLQRGATVRGELVDAQGASIKDASMISRLQISPLSLFWRGFPTSVMDGRFELTGLAPDQEYPVYFLESKRRLGATLTAKAGMDSPRVVLAPCGDVKMRFVDDAGKPVGKYEPTVQIVVTPGGLGMVRLNLNGGIVTADADFIQNFDRANHSGRMVADDEGLFTVPALIPGATYRILTFRKQARELAKEFQAKAGATVDLGDLAVERPE